MHTSMTWASFLAILVSCTPASAGDLTWSQDLGYSWHWADAYSGIYIANHDYQNGGGGSGAIHVMSFDTDDESFTAGQQAAAGAATTYSGNGIITSTCYADGAAWCNGNNTGMITNLWALGGGGSVDNNTLTDYMDIDDEFSFAFANARTEHDDRWRLISQSNSTTPAVINGSIVAQGLPSAINPWTWVDIEIQVGVDTDSDNEPDSWSTVFYANGSDNSLNVFYYFWDVDLYGPFLNYYEGSGSFDNNVPFEFLLSVTPGNWVRVYEYSGSSQDVGANDSNSNSGDHAIDFTLTLETPY